MNAQPPHPETLVPGFHSKTAYSFRVEDSDAILATIAYHRKDFDLAVIWFPPRAHVNIVTFILSAPRESSATLGELDKLPLELVNEICLQLDIASLFCFRQVNVRARQIINVLHEYRIINTHALNAFCALLRTQSAPGVTLLDFYHLLCTQECSLCGNEYGDLVYLLEWIRCCSFCLRRGAPGLRTATASKARRVLQLSKRSLEKLPKLRTVPGIYTMDEEERSSRVSVVPTTPALAAYREKNAGTEPAQYMLASLRSRHILPYMACCALPCYNAQTGQIENGVSCAGCQLVLEEVSKIYYKLAVDLRDEVYSRAGFLQHFVWCEQAQRLWVTRNRGTTESSKGPYSCKSRSYFDHRE